MCNTHDLCQLYLILSHTALSAQVGPVHVLTVLYLCVCV